MPGAWVHGDGLHPIETTLSTGLRQLLIWGAILSAAGLVFGAPSEGDGLFAYTIAHLTIVQIITFHFAIRIAPLTDSPWFESTRRPWLASVASEVAAVVGFSALLTLASSAAARYDVSLQFLQLLSSLDIAWVVATLYIGARLLWGNRVALVAGSGLLIACVVSIAMYLTIVGFTADGGWLVDGGEMLRVVLPSDVMAAVLSLTVLFVASRRHATEQARLQS